MKKVSLIGARGYIGKHLEWYLQQKGYEVYSYDIIEDETPNYCRCDVSKREELDKVNLDVDFVYMFAGLTGTRVGFDEYEAFTQINEMGLNHLLDAIKSSPYRPHVIFPSSRLVYKGIENALREDDEKESKTIYAVNKIACENLLYAYSNFYDIPYTIYRLCVPFGNMLAKDYSFGTVGFFIKQARSNGKITLYGDGQIKRTFTSMEDICRQIEIAAGCPESKNQVFNLGGQVLSLGEAANIIAEKFNASVTYIPFPEADAKIESGSTYFDSSKIEKLTKIMDYQTVENLFEK